MENPDPREQHLDAWLALTGQDPENQGTVRLPVLSGSMLPAIPLGAILEIELVDPSCCRVGDVVVFLENQQRLTAHRVLAHLGFGFLHWLLQKGDNNSVGYWIRRSRVRGRVTRVLPPEVEDAQKYPIDPDSLAPYSPGAALISRRQHWRNLALKWPRRIRDFLVT